MIAIKRVPLEDNLRDILKEIQHMNELHSAYTVEYKGSYLTNDILWVRKLKKKRCRYFLKIDGLQIGFIKYKNIISIILHVKISVIIVFGL